MEDLLLYIWIRPLSGELDYVACRESSSIPGPVLKGMLRCLGKMLRHLERVMLHTF